MVKKEKNMIVLVLLLFIGSSAPITSYKGVLDRFEGDDQAVILMESIQTPLVIPAQFLPPNSEENMWFLIEFVGGVYKVIQFDAKETKQQAQRSQNLIKLLQNKDR